MKLNQKCNKMDSMNKRGWKYMRSLGAGIASDCFHLIMVVLIVLNLLLLGVLVIISWKDLRIELEKAIH